MKKLFFALPLIIIFVSCASGIKIDESGNGIRPWHEPWVDGMNGVENLTFDGEGLMFVTGLDGTIYRIEPTEDPHKGKITAQIQPGKMCLGIAVSPDGYVYAGVADEDDNRYIYKMNKDLNGLKRLGVPIKGLNGFEIDKDGILYFASSNESFFFPKGGVYYADTAYDKSFDDPKELLSGVGLVNGLAFSNDESVLYFTETTGAVWAYDMKKGDKTRVYKPRGFLQIIDDLTVDPEGRLWVCLNARKAIVVLENGEVAGAFRPGSMQVPSACEFGKGPGFRSDFLYITEYGLKGRSFKTDGRGVWAVPVDEVP